MGSHRRALVVIAAVTGAVAVLAGVAVAASLPASERTFATAAVPAQLLVSVGVPFLSAVAASDVAERSRDAVVQTLVRAVAWAVAFGVLGLAVTATAIAALPSQAPEGRWSDAVTVALGSLVVQVVASLVGTGFGFLLRRPVLASLSTIVFPLGLWVLLGPVAPGARLWLTPMEGADRLLAGTMTLSDWPAYLVMLCVWVVALNAVGVRRLPDPTRSPVTA